jgi:DNA-binding NtrC family response regulator
VITPGDLPAAIAAAAPADAGRLAAPALPVSLVADDTVAPPVPADPLGAGAQLAGAFHPLPLKEYLHQVELEYIEKAVAAAERNKQKAASMLGVSVTTLYRKLTGEEPVPAAVVGE